MDVILDLICHFKLSNVAVILQARWRLYPIGRFYVNFVWRTLNFGLSLDAFGNVAGFVWIVSSSDNVDSKLFGIWPVEPSLLKFRRGDGVLI